MTRARYASQHQLIGYESGADLPRYTLDIPAGKSDALRKLVRFGSDDPEGYNSYRIDFAAARDLAKLINQNSPPENLDYFVECVGEYAR